MRAEARVDERVLLRLRFEHGDVPDGAIDREQLRRRMRRACAAERGVLRRAHRRRQPHAPVAIEHRVVVVRARVPDALVAPVRRRLQAASSAAACPGPRLSGICGSRTGILNVVALFSTGSRIGITSELYSGDPKSGPLALTVGWRRSLEMRSCRYCFSFIQSRSVTTMLRSTPCGGCGSAVRQLAFRDAIGPVAVVLERSRRRARSAGRTSSRRPDPTARGGATRRRPTRTCRATAEWSASRAGRADGSRRSRGSSPRRAIAAASCCRRTARGSPSRRRSGSSASSTSRSPGSSRAASAGVGAGVAETFTICPGLARGLRAVDQPVAARPDVVARRSADRGSTNRP